MQDQAYAGAKRRTKSLALLAIARPGLHQSHGETALRLQFHHEIDQSIGQLFVTRVAGNIATSAIIASLEYGVAVLGTKAIIVLGHANCGAVKASIEAKAVPGQISALYPYIRPAVDQAGTNLDAAVRANAKIQAALLRQSSPVLAGHIKQNRLTIVAGYYDLASGIVAVL